MKTRSRTTQGSSGLRRGRGAWLAVILVLTVALVPLRAPQLTASQHLPAQLRQDPLGPMSDVSSEWQHFQPAATFCVQPDGFDLWTELAGDDLVTFDQCELSGLEVDPCDPGVACLYEVHIPDTPILCPGCRRIFFDYSKIPPNQPFQGLFYAHGHVFFRLNGDMAPDGSHYTSEPKAHSPNIKNVTNDKLVAPEGSVLEQLFTGFDIHATSYVGHTKLTHHSAVQGPYYIGPRYVNRDGLLIEGAYVDLDLGDPPWTEVTYWAGFDSGETAFSSGPFACPNNNVPGLGGANALYAGCADRFGTPSQGITPQPFSPPLEEE